MDTPVYRFYGPVTEYRYHFLSLSIEKEIVKIVRFSETKVADTYNFVLLDMMADGGESNDKTETKNKDMNVVLATVMQIVTDFLDKNLDCFVHIEGSDSKRRRVYQILINREYDRLEHVGEFKILRIVSIFVATKRQEYDCTI
ncbi:MAG: hypothetical protein EAZ14_09065 [Runella slithyformis]|nr:MAG: hypothetical protein EAZ14_09065 [Runella slithyformis]